LSVVARFDDLPLTVVADKPKPYVLAVDDEEYITELIAMALSFNGFEVERAENGRKALASIEQRRPDLVVLDIQMPEMNGLDVVKRLRQNAGAGPQIPVILVTARDATSDKVEGLRLGVDDYITKPFSVEEMVERVKAVLRRSGTGPQSSSKLTFHDLAIDEDTRDVHRAGRFIELTPTEYKLLHYLLSNSRRVLTREQILEAVWDYTFAGNASVLETYISYLRQKVDATEPPLIHTARSVGYSLRLPAGWDDTAASPLS
jgi:two-component system, OmpR family, response regulator